MSERYWLWNAGVLLLLLLAGFLLYGKAFGHLWTYDDYPVIVENTDVRSIAAFFENHYPGRPLRELSYLIDYRLFGLEPAGYRVQNILWHVLNAFLLFRFSIVLGLSRVYAIATALLFLFHPISVEVVAQTSHRKDSLALFFSLLSLLLWREFLFRHKRRILWLGAAALAAGTALLAKEHAVVLPLLWFAYAWLCVPAEKRPFRFSDKVAAGLGMIFLLALLGRIVYLLQDQAFISIAKAALTKMADASTVSVAVYYLTALKAQTFLFGKWIWPIGLSPEYTFAIPVGVSDPWVLTGILTLAGVALYLVFMWRKSPETSYVLLWVLAGWLPTSCYFGYYSYFAADRYLYFSSAGLAFLAIKALSRWRAVLAAPVLLSLLLTLWVLSGHQIDIWQSPATLTKQIVKVNPDSIEGRIGLVDEAINAGKYAEADDQIRGLLSSFPNDAKLYNLRGRLLYHQGKIVDAIRAGERGVALNAADAEGFSNLGTYYAAAHQTEKAEANFQRALQINPNDERYHAALGKHYEDLGRYDLAEAAYREAIRCLPSYAQGYYNLGVVLYRQGELSEALLAFRNASKLQPKDRDSLYNLGVVAIDLQLFAEAEAASMGLQAIDPERGRELQAELSRARSMRH